MFGAPTRSLPLALIRRPGLRANLAEDVATFGTRDRSAVHLPYQRRPLHDLPDDPAAYDAVLRAVTEEALARLTPEGSLEHPAAGNDIGDTSLGITSLLALAWQRTKDPRLPEAVRRSLAFHLSERVHTEDNPGYPNLRRRNSGEPYARYVPDPGAHPLGDWPSTVWALLQAVNLLDSGDGILATGQHRELVELAYGYWRWLTQVTFFNPQEAGNQAIGCVVGGLMLARQLPAPDAPPGRGGAHFDARSETTQEQAAFALAADPRVYGDPDEGWGHLVSSTALEADPAPGAPDGLHVFAVRYGPGGPHAPTFAGTSAELTVRTEAFTARIGDPAGDAHGEPELEIRRR
jgi:hypothetical protein